MSKDNGITLTPQELDDIKDDIKWRTSMTIYMKELKGIPKKVSSLETHRAIHYFLLTLVLAGMFWFKFM